MQSKSTQKSQSFLKGTLILTGSIFVVKVLGILFRIFVTNLIGPIGSAYFNAAYEVYNPLFALATAGLPIAVSRLISENIARGNFKNVRRIYKISKPVFLLAGILGFLAMVIGAFLIPLMPQFNMPGAIYSILALAPTILFACLMSIYRGYYQGLRNMTPTAISEIIEAFCKFFIGYAVSFIVIKVGFGEYRKSGTVWGTVCATPKAAEAAIMPFASAGAIIGISIGAFLGFIYLVVSHKIKGDGITQQMLQNSSNAQSNKYIIEKLIRTAVPIGIGAIIMNIAGFIDTNLILYRIQNIMHTAPQELLNCYGSKIPAEVINNGIGVHTFLLGCYSFTLPLMMLVPAITQAFGVVALPSVTAAFTKKDKFALKNSIETVMRMTYMVTLPAGIGLAVLGPAMLSLIFSKRVDAVSIASGIIPNIGIATIFMASSTPVCSMLQAVGRVDLPVKIMPIGLFIKIIVNYILIGIPQINIQGAGVGTLIGYLFVLVISTYCLFKETGVLPNFFKVFLKPLLAALICGTSAYILINLFSEFLPNFFSLFLSLGFSIAVYILCLFIFKVLNKQDIKIFLKRK